GLGSAKTGVRHWWWQRITAVALIPLSLRVVASIITMIGADYDAVVTWIRSPIVAAFLVLLVVCLFYHSLLGVKVIIEDYVHNEGLKVAVLVGIQFIISALILVASIAILRIAAGVA
ncbi:MAG: succinate dehydrogenase, hydrophobic membrane anchor protein, partial [Gammaproteobacteria bacterium]